MSTEELRTRVVTHAKANNFLAIRTIARDFVVPWKDVDLDLIKVKIYTGGITNELFRCSVPDKFAPPGAVLIRLYGNGTEKLIDRTREAIVFSCLQESNFGPTFWGSFENGCVYSHVPGRALSPEDLSQPHLIPLIARHLGKWHATVTLSSFPRQSMVFQTIRKWLQQAPEVMKTMKEQNKLSFNDEEELKELQSIIETFSSPVVLCHNDLLSGNVVYNETENSIFFIDYEYANYNYRGFDIANHFCEYTGFEIDWRLFPDKQKQFDFLRAYLTAFNNGVSPTEQELENLYVEVNVFTLVSHWFWGSWAAVQSAVSTLSFDFYSYSGRRFSKYQSTKKDVLSLIKGRS